MSLSQRLLQTLSASAHPVPTPDLIAACAGGLSFPRQRVWAALRVLLAAGLVRRELRARVAWWVIA